MANLKFNPVPSVVPFLMGDNFIELIIGPIGCVAGDTLVVTEFGTIPIADIDRPMRVLSWNKKTCQYQLSWCGGSFPKGRDYLHQVATPEGEFAAAAHHRMLCDDGEYRLVQDLQQGDVVKTYSRSLHPTIEELCQRESHEDARRSSRKLVDFLGRCAKLDHQYGQQFLREADIDLASAPLHSDAQTSVWSFCSGGAVLSGAQVGGRKRHNRSWSSYDHLQIDGCLPPVETQFLGVAGRVLEEAFLHAEGLVLRQLQSLQNSVLHLKEFLSAPVSTLFSRMCSQKTPISSYSRSNRPILANRINKVKQVFWDMHVEGTNNYITVDGTIHHNSSKTTAGIMKVVYQAKKMAACTDGIRRSRAIWIRNTREQLRDTSIPDFLKWFPDGQAGTYMKSEYKFLLKFDDVECEVMFRGLDDTNDVRRLLSLQASFAILDEFREINKDIFEAVQGRLGRYPDSMMVPHREEWGCDDKGNPIGGCVTDGGKPNKHVWGMSNPPDMDTFWEKFASEPPKNAMVHFQPSGLSVEADWVKFLPTNYYEDLADGKSQDYIDVNIHAQFGKSLSGQPVFRAFKSDTHVSKTELRPINLSTNPLLIGMDFGLTPACTVGQIDPSGRLLVYADLVSEGMGTLRFVREKLKPLIAQRFAGMNILIIGDPAGSQRAQTDEKSVFDVLKAEGFRVIPAKTNSIAARINAVDSWLTRMADGKPALLIDPCCTGLIPAMRGGYRYKIKTNGELVDVPDKNKHSHVSDAFQYFCLHADNNATGQLLQTKARVVEKSNYMWA